MAAGNVIAQRRANWKIPPCGPAALFCYGWYGHTDCMRSIWKGSIAFGLVNVPVKVYSATEDHDIKFHQVHAKDNGRIRYQRVCELDGEVVEYRDIARAYESDDGQMVVITDDDISTLPEERSREIEVLEFVPASDVDPMMFDRSYFLEPDSKSSKSYVLLAKTLAETDRMAIVHFTLRNKTRLAALRVKDFGKRDVMVVHTLLWPDEIRDPDFPVLDKKVEIKPTELKMAGQVVESMAEEFNPDRYHDTYQEQLQELVDAKLEGGEAFTTEEQPKELDETEDVSDLLAKLEASVKARSGDGKAPAKRAPAEKTSAKKATAKKAPAKKTAAKKTPAKAASKS
jgi:DNA end-binding protein Ku